MDPAVAETERIDHLQRLVAKPERPGFQSSGRGEMRYALERGPVSLPLSGRRFNSCDERFLSCSEKPWVKGWEFREKNASPANLCLLK